MEDFTLSVNRETPPIIGYLLLVLWISGIITILILVIRSALRLHTLKNSALPLQSQKIQRLYQCCLSDTSITKNIPIYSTAYLKSPVIEGFLKPCIYLLIHLISDDNEADIRYMLYMNCSTINTKMGLQTIWWTLPELFTGSIRLSGMRWKKCEMTGKLPVILLF